MVERSDGSVPPSPGPTAAKLSRRFYEKFGDEIVTELVDWFNAVDATYRSDLRELNELNFARFDAKIERRFAEQDTKMERRFAQQDVKWEQRFARIESKIETTAAGLRTELVRSMFAFWTTNTLILAGLLVAVLRDR